MPQNDLSLCFRKTKSEFKISLTCLRHKNILILDFQNVHNCLNPMKAFFWWLYLISLKWIVFLWVDFAFCGFVIFFAFCQFLLSKIPLNAIISKLTIPETFANTFIRFLSSRPFEKAPSLIFYLNFYSFCEFILNLMFHEIFNSS